MQKLLIVLLVSVLNLENVWSNCINVPGEDDCYETITPLHLSVSKDDNSSIEINLSPQAIKFNKVKDHLSYHYLFLEHDSEQKPVNLHVASFQCLGEIPVTADARIIALEKKPRGILGIFISTGETAGDRYLIPASKRVRAEVFDQFLNAFEEKTSTEELENFNVFIPTILSNMSQDTFSEKERKIILKFFEETNSSLNGCSKRFNKGMRDFELNDLTKNPFIPNLKVIKDKSGYKIQIKKAP